MVIDSCLKCTRKHLRKACVTYLECKLGHPEKWDACLGNLAEASEAMLFKDEDMALFIREQYLKLEADPCAVIDFNSLFQMMDSLYQKEGLPCPKEPESR